MERVDVAIVGGGPAGVLALAAAVVLAVGVAHGLYRRSVRLAATDTMPVEDRSDTREV
jgi:thioredoxin reductase